MLLSRTARARCTSLIVSRTLQPVSAACLTLANAAGQKAQLHDVASQSPAPPHRRLYPTLSISSAAADLIDEIANASNPNLETKAVSSAASARDSSTPIDAAATVNDQRGEANLLKEIVNLLSDPRLLNRIKIDYFNQTLSPQLDRFRGQLPPKLDQQLTHLLDAACIEAINLGESRDALDLLRLSVQYCKPAPFLFNSLALSICVRIANQMHLTEATKVLLQELTEVWKLVSQLYRPHNSSRNLGSFALPPSADFRKNMRESMTCNQNSGRFTSKAAMTSAASVEPILLFKALFPRLSTEQAEQIMDGLAVTFCVLSYPRFAVPKMRKDFEPMLELTATFATDYSEKFQALLEQLLTYLEPKFGGWSSQLVDFVKRQWPFLIRFLDDKREPWRRRAVTVVASNYLITFTNQLRLAHRTRDRALVQSIWTEIYENQAKDAELRKALQADPEFMDYLAHIFCAQRLTEELKTCLELMARLKISLTLRTYTSMLYGWRLCRDMPKIDNLWNQLINAGVKLDAIIWTERLCALLLAGHLKQGIEALKALQANWNDAVAKNEVEKSGAVQPTIEMVNNIFRAVLNQDAKSAKQLLAWARSNGLSPDVNTYNIILEQAIKKGTDEVARVLKNMDKAKIEPNEVTFSIIVEETLSLIGSDTPEKQVESVNQVFAELEVVKHRSQEMYTTVLYAVAARADSDDAAVAAVMEHTRQNKVTVTPHMVTILVERALFRNPHSFEPVQAVLDQYGIKELEHGDRPLWERVVRAAAVTGRVDIAMSIFDRLAAARRPVSSLKSLTALLGALLAMSGGEASEQAQRVVDVIHRSRVERLERFETGSNWTDDRYFRHRFWYMAKENGLLRGKTVPDFLEEDSL